MCLQKIICLGDSNTWGYDPRCFLGGRYDEPWPLLLERQTGMQAVNFGENGRMIPHSDDDLVLMDRRLERLMPADALIVMLGSNDILTLWDHDPTVVGRRMADFLAHLRAQFPDVPVLLISPAAIDVEDDTLMRANASLGAHFAAAAAQTGCAFADAAGWGIPLSHDGVHFNEEGHRRFAERTSAVLNRLTEKGEDHGTEA